MGGCRRPRTVVGPCGGGTRLRPSPRAASSCRLLEPCNGPCRAGSPPARRRHEPPGPRQRRSTTCVVAVRRFTKCFLTLDEPGWHSSIQTRGITGLSDRLLCPLPRPVWRYQPRPPPSGGPLRRFVVSHIALVMVTLVSYCGHARSGALTWCRCRSPAGGRRVARSAGGYPAPGAEFGNDGPGVPQIHPRHTGEQMVFDLVVQPARYIVHEPAPTHIAGGEHLAAQGIDLLVRPG